MTRTEIKVRFFASNRPIMGSLSTRSVTLNHITKPHRTQTVTKFDHVANVAFPYEAVEHLSFLTTTLKVCISETTL